VGVVLLVAGTAAGSLAIFRPARQRMRKLEEAALALGAGHTSVRAPETGEDEVTALARAFNRMAADLEASNDARRRLLADVSHELKTPLTAMRGFIETLSMEEVALDADTGREAWRFHTIAHPGEPGGDSWNGAPADQRFGAGAWSPGSYDPDLGLVYFGTGNTYDTATLLEPRPGRALGPNDGPGETTTPASSSTSSVKEAEVWPSGTGTQK
jgi:HAMP domain-containing protein